MYISELRIRNFRNFMKARFTFREGVNTLIGENGSGKTNALHALRLLIDEALERSAINLREADFCRDLGQWRGHWIVISADFFDLDPSEGCQMLRHNAGHMDGTNSGTCTLYFRPKRDVRKKLHELSEEDDGVGEFLKTLTVDDYEAIVTGRARGDFLDDEMYARWAGDPESEEFPDPERGRPGDFRREDAATVSRGSLHICSGSPGCGRGPPKLPCKSPANAPSWDGVIDRNR